MKNVKNDVLFFPQNGCIFSKNIMKPIWPTLTGVEKYANPPVYAYRQIGAVTAVVLSRDTRLRLFCRPRYVVSVMLMNVSKIKIWKNENVKIRKSSPQRRPSGGAALTVCGRHEACRPYGGTETESSVALAAQALLVWEGRKSNRMTFESLNRSVHVHEYCKLQDE